MLSRAAEVLTAYATMTCAWSVCLDVCLDEVLGTLDVCLEPGCALTPAPGQPRVRTSALSPLRGVLP